MSHPHYRLSSHSPGRAPYTNLLLSKLEDFGSEWGAAAAAEDAVLQMKKKLPLVSLTHNHQSVPSEGPVDS